MDFISNLFLQRGIGVAAFTRSTIGTFDDGLVKTAAIDAARFEANGVLIEGDSTNEALHNRDFTNAAHVKTNITALKDAVGADGVTNSGSTLTATAANGTVFQTVTKLSAENTFSIDIRRKTGTGTIEISDDGGVGFTDITSSINSSTYTRFQITTTQANPSFGVRIVTSGDEIEVDYEQLEILPFASSRIETTTTSVTRARDNLSIDAANIPVPTADYSWGATIDLLGDTTTQDLLNVLGESFRVLRLSPQTILFHGSNNGVGDVIPDNTNQKIMSVKNSSVVKGYQDGIETISFTPSAVAGTKTDIRIGSFDTATNHMFGHIKNLKIYDVALTADQVKNL
jgi:hypothetical protein